MAGFQARKKGQNILPFLLCAVKAFQGNINKSEIVIPA